MKALMIEDEKKLAAAMQYLFKENGVDLETAFDGETGYEKALNNRYDVIILDVMLPKKNGFEVLADLRGDGVETPVIMLTALGTVPDKIKGLKTGADDYLTKPFDSDELLARIFALTRRAGGAGQNEISFGDLTLDCVSGELKKGDESVKLNYKEKELLKTLFAAKGTLVLKDALIDKVWGYDSDAGDNSLEAYISFLRKKLRYLGSRVGVKNYQKTGYRCELLPENNAGDNGND